MSRQVRGDVHMSNAEEEEADYGGDAWVNEEG